MKINDGLTSQFILQSNNNNNIQNQDEIGFANFLKNAVYSVSNLQNEAQQNNMKFITGEIDSIHEVMIAGQKADVALQAFIEVKNKVIEAYKEIMRIQV